MRKLIQNFSFSLLANGCELIVSAFSTLIVPKILGIREYSHWQLYVFYTSYVGFFHFGWADGIYLKQGGKRYADLDKEDMASQFRLYILFELLVMLAIEAVTLLLVHDGDRRYVLMFTGLCLSVTLPRTFLQYLLQATDRISDYARNAVFEKIIYVIGVSLLFFTGIKEYRPLLIVDLFAKAVTLLLMVYLCRDIVFYRISATWAHIREAWDNIRVGSKLMFANIAGLLINGIVKLFIEHHWGIETFGKASLTMSVSSMVMVFISAVSVVLYPMLRNVSSERLVPLYRKMRAVLLQVTLGVLLFYYPMRRILSAWLTQYADSLRFMALLFPVCVFESKTNMLTNTYFKVLRMEKSMMAVNWISVLFTLAFTFFSVVIREDLVMAMSGLMLAIGIKSTLAEGYLNFKLGLRVGKDIVAEWLLVLTFCLLSWNVDSWLCTAGYLAAYLAYSAFRLVPCLPKQKRG